MPKEHYQACELISLLEDLRSKHVSGALYLSQIDSEREPKNWVLVWKDGSIVYGGANIPDHLDFAKMLGQKLNREWSDTAINFALQKATNQTSIRSLLELLVKMRLFSWEQIENLVHTQVVLTIEQAFPHAGQYEFDSMVQFDLLHGLDWSKLMLDVTRRQEQWSALAPLIPSPDAIPHLQATPANPITDTAVSQHLQAWVDGQRSLVDIAEALNKDPLSIAQSYMHWVQSGWVIMESRTTAQNVSLPTILAVDDSVVMQKLIKRALAPYYRLLVAGNAADTMSLIHQEKISLLLLDVSMPDVNGLELCRTLRNISQFRDLPIIMLTGRDGMVDKLKGQLSGSTEYLTKPFDAENLRQVVEKHLSVGTT